MDAHPPFQIDGNFGGTAGVCEMLIQSHRDVVELLPALPAAWKEGSVSGLCVRGGYELAFSWHEGRVTVCTIKAKKNGNITLLFNNQQRSLRLKAGEIHHVKI